MASFILLFTIVYILRINYTEYFNIHLFFMYLSLQDKASLCIVTWSQTYSLAQAKCFTHDGTPDLASWVQHCFCESSHLP